MGKFITGSSSDQFSIALCHTLGLDPKQIRRIVIDLEAGRVGRILYETFADQEALTVALSEVQLEVEDKPSTSG